jgi:hypothetical protein
VLALAIISLPPLSVPSRLDRLLYDQWSRLTAPEPPERVAVLRLPEPGKLDDVARLARLHNARLIVSTTPDTVSFEESAIGPTAVAFGEGGLLRPTGWARGGHLWLVPDDDGVLRYERPLIDDTPPIPSLALAAAAPVLTETDEVPRLTGTRLVVGHRIYDVDSLGRRAVRFYRPGAIPELTLEALAADPGRLDGVLLIVGHDETHHATPVGLLTTRDLIAQIAAGYEENRAIAAGGSIPAIAWSIAGVLLAGFALLRNADRRWPVIAGLTGAFGLLGISVAAFAWLSVWLPIGGPALLLLTAGLATLAREPERPVESAEPSKLVQARRLAGRGFLVQAWSCYQQVGDQAALVAELYELGRSMKAQGLQASAEEVFHYVAHLAPDYEGVTQPKPKAGPVRLIAAREQMEGPMPRTLGRYELLEEIGRGAMGAVYLGRDPKINRPVAIKAIDLSTEFDPDELEEASQRFLREAETAGRLNHPNIVTIFDVGESGGLAYIAMEFLRGKHLNEHSSPDALLPVPLVLELVARAGDALHYAHKQNIVHRDIKPANIMYDAASDGLKITDFGTARLIDASRTRTGIVVGTPSFMAPEQLEGKNVNGHTDLFALGVTLYQLLTGHLPFRGSSMTKLMFAIANEPHPPLSKLRTGLPAPLQAIIDRALAKNPMHRFASGGDMAAALRAAACR